MPGISPRLAAQRIVWGVYRQHQSLDNLLRRHLGDVDGNNRALTRELASGTLRHFHALQTQLGSLLERPLKAADSDLECVLLLALYQLAHTRQRQHAVVNEAVKLARTLGKPWARGLINAVLRRYLRERESAYRASPPGPESNYPHWIVKRLQADWPDQWQNLLIAGDQRPPMWLRANQQQTDRDEYLRRLHSIDCQAEPGSFASAIRLVTPSDVHQLPGFKQGMCSVQDLSAQLTAPALAPSPGMRVLDACAAPGGKLTHLLENSNGDIRCVAVDLESRVRLIQDNLARVNHHAEVRTGDIREVVIPGSDEFDAIMLDAPCSGSGVIRRHPDIKLLRRETDIAQMAETQFELLCHLWKVLAPGGRLLYITCSLFRLENADVVNRFLSQHPDAATVDLGEEYGVPCHPGRQRLTGQDEGDGFYYCLLMRRNHEL